MVVEADNTSELPYSIFVLPELNELRLADWLGILVSRMATRRRWEAIRLNDSRLLIRPKPRS